MEELAGEFIPMITHTAPGVKTGCIKWVERSVLVTYIDVLQRISDDLLAAVAKATNDKDGGVRDLALHLSGILKGRLGEGPFSKHIKGLNP